MSQTRTIQLKIAPELAAYVRLLDDQPGRPFVAEEYDLFAAGYRAALDERGLRTDPPLGEVNASSAVDQVRGRVWPERDAPQGLMSDV